jgi:hypothetical protein
LPVPQPLAKELTKANENVPPATPLLEWKIADLSPLDGPLSKDQPKTMGEEREWLIRYLLEKNGGTVSVNSMPAFDENAWICARQYDAASKDTATLYILVGQHMLIADDLLQKKDALQKQQGLAVSVQAARCARNKLKDNLLATAITDVYILPNLDLADEREWTMMSKTSILEDVIATYSQAKATEKLANAYKLFIASAPAHRADVARLKLAQLYEKQGQREKAVDSLNEIKPNGSVRGARSLIPKLQNDTKNGDSSKKGNRP